MQPHRFILQALDPNYGHPAFETMFAVERLQELRALLGVAADKDPDLKMRYTLDADDVAAITRHFGVAFDPEGRETCLRRWKPSEIPYLVHTNYELALLIDGRKQFARMDGYCYPPHRYRGEELFDRCVVQGLLHKEVELEPFHEPLRRKDGRVSEGLRTVYYTREGEEWRIPAWKLVWQASRKSGWNEHFERLEGMLFGYEDWQNDWWIEHIRKSQLKWGTMLAYAAVTADELAGIEENGYRALPRPKRTLKIVGVPWHDADDQPERLMEEVDTIALVRFRVRVRRFLELMETQKEGQPYRLPPDRVKDLNRLILDDIEIAMRREAAAP
jgi:hypothetical protein